MTVTFHADGSSYQGNINWATVRKAGFGGGAEKVTQGTTYENPDWPAARAALLAEAGPEFTPGAYLYLTAGNGAGQADYFASKAGNIPGFVIWVDLERAAGVSPSVTDARDCTARLRVHYPHNRVGIYAGESFTGTAYLTFADLLWSPHYVTGTGTPAAIYRSVPASFWDAYGGRTPVLLQFSQTATVPGVAGQADVSAFRGTAVQMRAALLGIAPPAPAPKPAPAPVPVPAADLEEPVLANGPKAQTLIVAPAGAKAIWFGVDNHLAGQPAAALRIATKNGAGWNPTGDVTVDGAAAMVPVPLPASAEPFTISVQRSDAGTVAVGYLVA